jgi:glucokinase
MFLKEKKIPVIIGDIGGTNSRLSIVKMSKVRVI